jgi:hypothetical protein
MAFRILFMENNVVFEGQSTLAYCQGKKPVG